MADPVLAGLATTDNAASTSHTLNFPAHSAGALVLVHVSLASSRDVTLVGTGPNGEALAIIIQRKAFTDGGGVNDGSAVVIRWVASADSAAGTIAITVDSTSSLRAVAGYVPAGDFNATAPIINQDARYRASALTHDSLALTAGDAGGRLVNFMAVDTSGGLVADPTGWTTKDAVSNTGSSAILLSRNAVTTASESVPATTFELNAARRCTTVTYIIAPAAASGVTATGTAVLTLAATAAGVSRTNATATAAFTLSGTATGTSRTTATAGAAFALTSASTGTSRTNATATASFILASTATGESVAVVLGTATFTLAGGATGTSRTNATATPAFTFASTSAGTSRTTATATALLTLTTTATGESGAVVLATAVFTLASASTATSQTTGTGTAVFDLTNSATGTGRTTATSAAAFTLAGTATGASGAVVEGTAVFTVAASGAGLSRTVATGTASFTLSATATGAPALTVTGSAVFLLASSGTATGRTTAIGSAVFTLAVSANDVAGYSGLLAPAVTLSVRYAPSVALAPSLSASVSLTPSLRASVSLTTTYTLSPSGAPTMAIDAKIYPNNDANIRISGLPTGLTVDWFIGLDADATTPVGDCFGTCDEDTDASGAVVYTDVMEGSLIADALTVGATYALIVKVGTDLRVYGLTRVQANRLANA